MVSHVIRIDLNQLPGWYRQLGPRLAGALKRGALRGGLRAVSTLQRATGKAPPANAAGVGKGGAVHTGHYKRSWKVEATSDGARVFNDATYSGVIELGRRAGAAMPPPRVFEEWARRRLGLSAKEAKRAAFPIARAIARRGLKGRLVLTDSLKQIEKDFIDEVLKELAREIGRGGKR